MGRWSVVLLKPKVDKRNQTKVLLERDFRLKVLTKYCIQENYGFLSPRVTIFRKTMVF